MKIVCVMDTYEYVGSENDIINCRHNITIGKSYEVENILLYEMNNVKSIGEYTIMDDDGKLLKMSPHYFITLEEHRIEQLKILGI